MAEKIDQLLVEQPETRLFIGYTAPHVVGEFGIVKQLQEKGWAVTQSI